MIFSKDHNFLLIKNKKVGGTSVEVELSKVMPHNAIVTKIVPENPNHVARNHDGFYNHMSYSEAAKVLDLSEIKAYTIIRNPIDVVLSHFFHELFLVSPEIDWNKLNDRNKEAWKNKYFNLNNDHFLKSTKNLYTDSSGNVCVDGFIFYEDGIEPQLNKILTNHSIPNIQLNTFEKEYRPKNVIFSDVFTQDNIDLIMDEWGWEFDYFGYKV